MRLRFTAIALALVMGMVGSVAHAGSLQVSPVSIEMKAPSAATSVLLTNSGKETISAQVRIFRWSQIGGEEKLEPVKDIVASPPMATIAAGKEFTVRLVRLSKAPVASEETFRIIVDELPGPQKIKHSGVDLNFRYSIPVFVTPRQVGKANLTWSVAKRDGKTLITAVNDGDRRVRIHDFKVKDAKGKQVTIAQGLAGYVLARSSMSWVAPGTVQVTGGSPLLISAQGDQGAIHAEARSDAGR